MQIRPAFRGALLGLWLCLFTSSFCYGDDKTVEVAGEPNKVFTEFKPTEAVELNEEGKFAVRPPRSLLNFPIVKKPFPPKPYLKKPPLHEIPIVDQDDITITTSPTDPSVPTPTCPSSSSLEKAVFYPILTYKKPFPPHLAP